jgi:hypothetical protein
MRHIAILAAVSLVGAIGITSAHAATYGGKSVSLSAEFAARLAAVCQSRTLVLTASAKTACESGAFPRVTAAATAFVNNGTGAELNTLMRQLPQTLAAK